MAIVIECFKSRDGRVFTNVIYNGKQLAHLRAGDTCAINMDINVVSKSAHDFGAAIEQNSVRSTW